MEISDLRSFLVIARYANLRTAANELHQSPSALSKAVRRLEALKNLYDRGLITKEQYETKQKEILGAL